MSAPGKHHHEISSFRADKDTVSGKFLSKFKHYPCAEIYEYSKFCMLLFTYELHRQLNIPEGSQQVSVIGVDPGSVKTNIMREVPWSIRQVLCTGGRNWVIVSPLFRLTVQKQP